MHNVYKVSCNRSSSFAASMPTSTPAPPLLSRIRHAPQLAVPRPPTGGATTVGSLSTKVLSASVLVFCGSP